MKALALVGATFLLAGPGPADIQDSQPMWASDGVHVAFQRGANVLEMTSAGKDVYVAAQGTLRGWIPGTTHLLVQSGDETLVITGDRYQPPLVAFHGTDATASPDGTRVAFLRAGTLYLGRVDGSGERAIASGVDPPSWDVTGPVWSPDGTRIVVASGSSLLLVNTNGTGSHVLFTGTNQSVNPSWSPDGQVIAFERNAGAHWQAWIVRSDGTLPEQFLSGVDTFDNRYPRFSPVSDTIAYISDRQHVQGGATPYQYALYTQRAEIGSGYSGLGPPVKLVDDVHPDSPPAWSPTAALIAVAAGQECRRWGIYVVRSDGGTPQRHSNICRFTGTTGADTIRGSYYFDLIRGLGGDDHIFGLDGNDRIEGNGGNDVIAGGNGNDVIFGGPGNDRIYGGPGNDLIIPGNGRDWVDCGPGNDTVEGTGPLDRISPNCEHVRR